MALQQHSFAGNTRHKILPLTSQASISGQIKRWEIDKAGILAGLWLDITGTVATGGSITGPNALGFASIIRQVRLYLSTGVDIILCSGPGYHYLIRDHVSDYKDPVSFSNARSAVSAAAYDISMYFPIALNERDLPGLLLLQQDRVTYHLSVEQETDANVATGISTNSPTITPWLEVFTVPPDPADRPPFTLVHSWMEESQVVAGAGQVEYVWPRGNTILQMLHGLGMGVSGADGWSQALLRVQQNDRIYEYLPAGQKLVFGRSHGRARLAGTLLMDMLGSSGLGSFGSARDAMETQNLTSIKSVVTATGAGTLYSVRRELVAVKAPDTVAG